jgi:4-amino-4-deoxy-L-arabinose transferase-like glycosyltransferase
MGGTYYPAPRPVQRGAATGPWAALGTALLLALVAGALFFFRLGGHPLLDPDEARHAEVAREMATAGGPRQLFLPTLELRPYREKPAPYYWLVALAYAAAGVDEAAARSVSALAALATVLACFAYAVPRHGVAGALGAGLVLATSAGWFGFARYANLDMTLTACVTAGVLAGLAWLDRPRPGRPPLAPFVAAGLGTLVKGPVAAALVAGPLALAVLTRRPRPALAELGLGRGLAVAAAITALFYVPLGLLDAGYLQAFATTNLRRFVPGSRHEAPAYYYLFWLPVMLLPWTPFAVPAVARAARDPARRPLVLWVAFVPGLMTLAQGKLASYVLSALVPLALLVGPELARAARAGPGVEARGAFRAGGWLAVAVLAATALAAPLAGLVYPIAPAGRLLLAATSLGWGAALFAALRHDRLGRIPLLLLGAMLTLYPMAAGFVAPAVSTAYSHRDAARLVARAGRAPVLAFSSLAPSLVFYLRAPLVWTEDTELVRELFRQSSPVFLVTGRRHFETIERVLGARAHLWWGTRRRRLYANRPPPEPEDESTNGSP